MRSYFCDCFEDQKYGHRGSFNVYIKQNQKGQPMRREKKNFLIPPCIFALLYCKLHGLAFKCTMSKAKHLHSTYAKRELARGTKEKYFPNAFNAKLPTHLPPFWFLILQCLPSGQRRTSQRITFLPTEQSLHSTSETHNPS